MNKKTAILTSRATISRLKVLAKEKERIRLKLAKVARKLSLKTKELAITTVKTKAILASIGDAVMACDEKGLVILFNRKAALVTGFSAREVIGKKYDHFIKFVRELDSEPIKDFIAEAMKTGQKTVMADNTLLIKKNGTRVPVADSAEPIRYTGGALIGCVVVFRDITQEKETDKAKSEFISVASHQLKTPATIVNLYTEMLLSGPESVISLKQKEYINEIRSANQRMIDIVKTLLNVSRIEMGIFAVDPIPTDVIPIFQNVIKEVRTNIEEKRLVVQQKYHQEKCIVPIDRLLLQMVFSNLVSNALQYTPVGGTIVVRSVNVKKGEKIHNHIIREKSLLVSVADSGCGIPADHHKKIFTRFFRSESARKQHADGTGLGLYIVKSILDHIGGHVWFNSKEKVGTIFYFTVPLHRKK